MAVPVPAVRFSGIAKGFRFRPICSKSHRVTLSVLPSFAISCKLICPGDRMNISRHFMPPFPHRHPADKALPVRGIQSAPIGLSVASPPPRDPPCAATRSALIETGRNLDPHPTSAAHRPTLSNPAIQTAGSVEFRLSMPIRGRKITAMSTRPRELSSQGAFAPGVRPVVYYPQFRPVGGYKNSPKE